MLNLPGGFDTDQFVNCCQEDLMANQFVNCCQLFSLEKRWKLKQKAYSFWMMSLSTIVILEGVHSWGGGWAG